ncbi:NADP-dependent oxidoreductase domain-containing protein 1 [Rana temporaria]|uniref:NADP-dependent oxidoreductase domain-containing protein 1 n=1 Tax=Rana temporaria TaxID=8407 RepID=UPI001AAC6DD6|nr:NADP-dependent oxidoreductase domain-containing protein 1 [Rana temporaria]
MKPQIFSLEELQIPAEPEELSATMEIIAGLGSLQFEAGVSVQHQSLVKLKTRRRDLTEHACAHSVFFCQVLLQTRQALQMSRGFHVGVIGGGYLGKQLVRCLLDLTDLHADDISVSTRRPETLRDLQGRGVKCFYDNVKLVRGAHIVFLCCLPSQLPAVCAEIRGHLPEWCVVYSLVSAVPLPRVTGLLGHSGVIRPEYQCDPKDDGPQCHHHGSLTKALKDGSLVRATIPGELWDGECDNCVLHPGGVCIVSHFMEPVLYAVLNLCTSHDLSHDQAVSILNGLIQQRVTSGESPVGAGFTSANFVSKAFLASLSADSRFPRFDLSSVQMKETPLSQHLAGSAHLRTQLSSLYCTIFHTDTQRVHLS